MPSSDAASASFGPAPLSVVTGAPRRLGRGCDRSGAEPSRSRVCASPDANALGGSQTSTAGGRTAAARVIASRLRTRWVVSRTGSRRSTSIFRSLEDELGDLDRVTGWVKALGLVNCAPGFNKTPAVVNGFSELVLEVWGDAGRHARSAIGVAELPFDWPVEVEAVVELG